MKCPKCGGELMPQDNGFLICMECGGRFRRKEPVLNQTPEIKAKETESNPEKKLFVEERKDSSVSTDNSNKLVKHKTKILIAVSIIIAIAIIVVCLILFIGGNGMYYSVNIEDDCSTINKTSWLRLDNGIWEKSDETEGKYVKIGNKIVFYQNDVKIAEGTLKRGTLTIRIMDIPVAYRTTEAQERIKEKKK